MRLQQKMRLELEPDVQDKIRVRHIEIVDDADNIVASIGTKDGIYEEGKKPIFQIFSESHQVEVEISDKGIVIHYYGDDDDIFNDKSIRIRDHSSIFSGIDILTFLKWLRCQYRQGFS